MWRLIQPRRKGRRKAEEKGSEEKGSGVLFRSVVCHWFVVICKKWRDASSELRERKWRGARFSFGFGLRGLRPRGLRGLHGATTSPCPIRRASSAITSGSSHTYMNCQFRKDYSSFFREEFGRLGGPAVVRPVFVGESIQGVVLGARNEEPSTRNEGCAWCVTVSTTR